MDPLSLMSSASSLIGMGVQAYGMMGARTAASDINADQTRILGQEEGENQLRQKAMVMSAQRQQVQTLRNAQRARAQGVASSTAQGANMGSGLATDSAASEGAYGVEGINRNMQLGQKIFGVDSNIDQLKMQMGGDQTSLYNAQGIMGLGSAISGSGQKIGQLGMQGFGALNNAFAPNLGFS